jgi:hypothetical protein
MRATAHFHPTYVVLPLRHGTPARCAKSVILWRFSGESLPECTEWLPELLEIELEGAVR